MKKLINFPTQQIQYINKQCSIFGNSFSEYIRILIAFDMARTKRRLKQDKSSDLDYSEIS